MQKRLSLLAAAVLAVVCVATAAAGPTARTPASVVVGEEGDVAGFNTALTCCGDAWAHALTTPVVRGAFLVDDRLRHVRDLVAGAKATRTTLTYTIRKNASWNWGGRKLPVTWQDFAYTWQMLVDPRNAVADRRGYDQITGFTHKGDRRITFTWKQPYGAWQDLFSTVYPSAALAGQDFNSIWTSCICGNDGKPVSDGPYVLESYVRGQGSTLAPNPFWYGRKPRLKTVVFRVVSDTNAEVQAMRGGEVDAIAPTFGINLLPLKSTPRVVWRQVPGLFQEHIDIQFGPQGQPLLRAPWMRQAIMLGIDRRSIMRTVYGELAGSGTQLDSALYAQTDAAYRRPFSRWSYNPSKALTILRRHCTGGPLRPSASNTAYWTCSAFPAQFRFTWAVSNASRTTQEAIIKSELRSIGIQVVDDPLPANAVLGAAGVPSGNFDLADFAWNRSADPAPFVGVFGCAGVSNYTHYCNATVTRLLAETDVTLDQMRRAALFREVDGILAKDVPTIPMYSRPSPLIWKAGLLGLRDNVSRSAFTWNIETWHWRR